MTLQGLHFSPQAKKVCEWALCTGLLATLFSLLIIDVNVAVKLFSITGFVALIYLISERKSILCNKTLLILAGIILLLGIYNIMWLELFKPEKTVFSGTYRAYLYAGRVLIVGAIVILAFGLIKQSLRNLVIPALALIIMTALVFACVEEPQNGQMRIMLAFKVATTMGYAVSLTGIVCSAWLIQLKPKFYPVMLAIITISVLSILALNETRAAMLTYPVIIMLMLLVNYSHSATALLKRTAVFLALLIVCGFVMKDVIQQRTSNLMSDIESYQKNNSNTSVGARLAMYKAGLSTAKFDLTGQSIEARQADITELVKREPALSGASLYLNVHLHNEVIESLSLKGILGTLILIVFYLSLIYYAFSHKNMPLFGVTLAIILFGISDVLFYSREMPIVATACIALCILLQQNKINDERKANS
ncbi:O-antigen ligase family protein [Superficieibacter sp.]|uniref:O-antigen ligase family protein n=1 Tax=Superficieibacter sp. TaxID=2303322 RepID=UPI0028ACAA31|nr:O-antigen ligase family protein [Superficieibacter sp.]